MTVHAAVTRLEGEECWWASLDGETWLPVNQPPLPTHEKDLAAAFEGDGNFKPMVFTRWWLEHEGANFLNDDGIANRRIAWEISRALN
jgi:hypothetical protein